MEQEKNLTQLLHAADQGDKEAREVLFKQTIDQLKSLAHRVRQQYNMSTTLDTNALISDMYLRLFASEQNHKWVDRTHFFNTVSRVMLNIYIDYLRKKQAAKRNGGVPDLSLDEFDVAGPSPEDIEGEYERLSQLQSALQQLREIDERQEKIVSYRFILGFSYAEIANILTISESTVKREWRSARAFLSDAMQSGDM